MKNKETWLSWIDDQLNDIHNDNLNITNNNRVFKTIEDDRDVAKHLLLKLRKLINEK